MVDVEGPGIAQAQPSIRWLQPWCPAPPPARAVELTVAKNRQGDTGKLSLPRSRGLNEHGVFSCAEYCLPAHKQGWGDQLEEEVGKKCQ
jgi:hypothetical protein